MQKAQLFRKAGINQVFNAYKVNISQKKWLHLTFRGARPILFSWMIIIISVIANAQEVYEMDPYRNYTNECVPKINGLLNVQASFAGEYLINRPTEFINDFPDSDFSYKVEVVSFPFFPDNGYDGSDPTNCKLTMPWQSLPYNANDKSWGKTVFHVFSGPFVQGPPNMQTWSETSALVSLVFCGINVNAMSQFAGENFVRPYYPHTIHKITIYVKKNGMVKDSIFWYADNTRGRMNYYPFGANPSLGSCDAIDVHFRPLIQHFDCEDYVLYKNNKMVHSPLFNPYASFFPGWEGTTYCSQPPLTYQIAIPNSGIYYKHTYTIDYPFDLTIINPLEQRIFNPSEVDIDLNNDRTNPQIFPTGYTFETIKPLYPLKTEVEAIDNTYLYRDLTDVSFSNDVFVPESQHRSIYNVKSGSKLVIEPCVTIIDADILVEDGGEVVYNANQVYLINATIAPAPGATNAIITDNYLFQGTFVCQFDCYKLSNYTPNTKNIEISQTQTWTSASLLNDYGVTGGELKVSGEIIVESPYHLTLDPSVVLKFSPNSRIIIKPGAKLTVNGATLTSACNEFWRGIEVWGDHQQSQIPKDQQTGLRIHQGEVQVINDGTIENAINAIAAIKTDTDGNKDWSKTGGVIILDDANMINNNFDVWIGAYHNVNPNTNRENRNQSYIVNSRFEKNDNMPAGYNGYAFVGLWDVGTILIKGNTFKNLKTNLNIEDRGHGIVAYSATINLIDYCPSSGTIDDPLSPSQATTLNPTPCQGAIRNHFEGLYYGVWASNVKGDNSIIHIDRAEFEDVYHGIYLHNAEQPIITRSNFSITATDPDVNYNPDITYAYGIYLDVCEGYRIEENSLTHHAANESIYGIVINESGPDNNEIYKNYMNSTGYAIQAQGNNRGENKTGLGIYCNEMQTEMLDIMVLDNGIALNQLIRIDYNNVPYSYAAGNMFTTGFHYDYQHYANTSPLIINYFPDDNNIPQYRYRVNIPEIPPLSLSCPSKFANSLLASLDNLNDAKIAFNSAEIMLHIWQDGGNANLEQEVETTLPWDVYVQFNELMAGSPYLSDEVLLAAINNPVFSSLMIKLLMAANTHGIHNPEIMQAIWDRLPPLPETYIAEIESSFDLVSQLELLRADVAATRHRVDILSNDIKRTYQMDLEDGEDVLEDLISFLESINTLPSRYDLAALYMQTGNFGRMDSILNEIPNDFELDDMQLEDLENWQTYFGVAAGLKQSGVYPRALSQAQIDALDGIALLENSEVASAAKALLMFNQHGYEYKEIVKTAPEQMPRKGNPDPNLSKTSAAKLKVYPNPCHDYITLEYHTGNKYNSLWVELTDATGKTVLTQKMKGGDHDELLGITELKPGVYFVRLIGDNALVAVQRITVIR